MIKSRKHVSESGRPREIVNGYRAMHLMPRAWIPVWNALIEQGKGISEADLIRQACMKAYPELPDPRTPEFRKKQEDAKKPRSID